MKARFSKYLFFSTLLMGSAHAAITVSDPNLVVTDHPQTGGDSDFYNSLTNLATGNAPAASGRNRISLDVNDVLGQSFTLSSAITLDSIYFGYNDQQSSGSFALRIDVGNDGSLDYIYTVGLTTPVVNVPPFSGGDLQTGGGNGGPFHFLQFDLSAENIVLGAGVHSFTLLGVTDDGPGGYLFGPTDTGNNYAGGTQISGTGGTGSPTARDFLFAVTSAPPIPEPSAGLLALVASSALFLRRRRA